MNSHIEFSQINSTELSEYAKIPMTFEVRSKLDVELIDDGLGGMQFREVDIEPYLKDYDALNLEDGAPTAWPKTFDISNWGLFLVRNEGIPIAGTAVAFNTPGLHMLDGRSDLAVLWDMRVHPDHRGSGLGTGLFQKAVEWAKSKNCTRLKVETQNINVPACRFYVRQGCRLGEINRFKYIDNPKIKDEVMLVWYLDL